MKHAQYYVMIYNCTVKEFKHTNPKIEDVFLSSLILLKNGFVLGMNIYMDLDFQMNLK